MTMKKEIVILLLMLTSLSIYGQTSKSPVSSTTKTEKLTRDQELFYSLGSWLIVNVKYGHETKKRFIVQPYISKGYSFMWQVEEEINKLPKNEESRNIFLDYLYDMILLNGKDAIIQSLVEGRMTIENAKDLMEYVQTKHKLSMEKRGLLK